MRNGSFFLNWINSSTDRDTLYFHVSHIHDNVWSYFRHWLLRKGVSTSCCKTCERRSLTENVGVHRWKVQNEERGSLVRDQSSWKGFFYFWPLGDDLKYGWPTSAWWMLSFLFTRINIWSGRAKRETLPSLQKTPVASPSRDYKIYTHQFMCSLVLCVTEIYKMRWVMVGRKYIYRFSYIILL